MYEIKFIESAKMNVIIPFLQILDSKLETLWLENRIQEMLKNGYQCVGVYDGERLIGVSGLWIIQKYYTDKHIEPDNVVIHPDYRGKGAGEELSKWIDEYAQSIGAVASNLNCYTTNNGAIKLD